MLDTARYLVVKAGPRVVGIRDIAHRSAAPSGSLYLRFHSRDKLVARALARLWGLRRVVRGAAREHRHSRRRPVKPPATLTTLAARCQQLRDCAIAGPPLQRQYAINLVG